MRAKHIVLPIIALTIIAAYALHDSVQKSKFNSELWIATHKSDVQNTRANLLSPLMAHVLKVGMSLEKVDELLGVPAEERIGISYSDIGSPRVQRIYKIERENTTTISLVLEFSHTMKLTDYYIEGRARPYIF